MSHVKLLGVAASWPAFAKSLLKRQVLLPYQHIFWFSFYNLIKSNVVGLLSVKRDPPIIVLSPQNDFEVGNNSGSFKYVKFT